MPREETVPKKSEKDQRRRAVTGRLRWPPSGTRLRLLIAEAIVDAYDDSEQRVGFLTMFEESLALPFETDVLGVKVTVERIDLNDAEEIVAICCNGGSRQAVSLVDLPLPSRRPAGAEWIEAYRRWAHGR